MKLSKRCLNYDMNSYQNMSADLRRLAYWIYEGRDNLAQKMLKIVKEKYKGVPISVGCYENIWKEIEDIENIIKEKFPSKI